MSLDVVHDEHRRHRPRELAERVEDVLRLPGDAGLERRVVDLGAAPDAGTVGPGPRRPGMERAAGAELALGERLHRGGHVGVVRRAVGLEDPFPAGRVGYRPALVLVVPEPEAGHVRVARGAEYGEEIGRAHV